MAEPIEPGAESRDDPIGTASARLLAGGLARHERRAALRLLGLLGDHTDRSGRVRLPLNVIAGEFGIPLPEARRNLIALLDAGSIEERDGALYLAGEEPADRGPLRLADFLDNVEAVLQSDPAPVHSLAARRRRRLPVPVPALSAGIAAAALIVALAVSPSLRRDRVAEIVSDRGPSSTVTTSDRGLAGRQPGPVMGGAVASAADSSAAGTSSGTGTSATPNVSGGVTAPGGGTSPVAATRCPDVIPVLGVTSVDRQLDDDPQHRTDLDEPTQPGSVRAETSLGTWVVIVDGTIANPSSKNMTIEAFEVSVLIDGKRHTVPGSDRAIAVAAGQTVRWEVRISSAEPTPPEAGDASARLLSWTWTDEGLARTCPS